MFLKFDRQRRIIIKSSFVIILNSFLFGVTANHTPALNGNGNYNLGAILNALKVQKVSNALWGATFLLNGGSPNNAWGISFIKLVANQTK